MHWLISFISIALAGHTAAAGFDCSKARSFAEETVCSNSNLSGLDSALNHSYRLALQRTADKTILRTEQTKWLRTRDACDFASVSDAGDRKLQANNCLRSVYQNRLRELAAIAFSRPGTGVYRCHYMGESGGAHFEITNGVITSFSAATAVSHPDLRGGYTYTCKQGLGMYYQTESGNENTLEYYLAHDPYLESTDCEVRITDLGTAFHFRTRNCRSECMQFDTVFDKSTCYQEQRSSPNQGLNWTRDIVARRLARR